MEEVNLAQFLGVLGVLSTAFASIIVAVISRSKSPQETGAVERSKVHDLIATLDTLGNALDRERSERLEDILKFEKQVADLRNFYREQALAMDNENRNLIAKIREDYRLKVDELKEYYEGKIERLEQAHRDRVTSLRQRIRALEKRVENGNGN